MKKIIILCCMVVTLCFCLSGCSPEMKASYDTAMQASEFEVLRQLTVINDITEDVIFVMTGRFNIKMNSSNQLEITVKNDDNSYSKHFVGLSNVATYTVIDIDNNCVDRYKFTINYNPGIRIPLKLENID